MTTLDRCPSVSQAYREVVARAENLAMRRAREAAWFKARAYVATDFAKDLGKEHKSLWMISCDDSPTLPDLGLLNRKDEFSRGEWMGDYRDASCPSEHRR